MGKRYSLLNRGWSDPNSGPRFLFNLLHEFREIAQMVWIPVIKGIVGINFPPHFKVGRITLVSLCISSWEDY